MFRQLKHIALSAFVLILPACSTYSAKPDVSSPHVQPSGSQACPQYTIGEGPLIYRFPDACQHMLHTESGIRFIPLRIGNPGLGQPTQEASIVVQYEGFLDSTGTRIASSYARGVSGVYDVPDLIPGWSQFIQMMSPGDVWIVHIPASLAYGEEGLGETVPPDSDLVFRVHLEGYLSFDVQQSIARRLALEPDMAAWEKYMPWESGHPEQVRLDSGVSYIALEAGPQAGKSPNLTDQVVLHYEGRLAGTGATFDNSWVYGRPATFMMHRLIPGVSEMLELMRPGDRVLVRIPASQAYAESGAGDIIPPEADLIFQLLLVDTLPTEASRDGDIDRPQG